MNIKYWSDDKGKWIDCVLDVTSLGYVSEFTVRFDVRRNDTDQYINSPAGTFYLDAAAINQSEEPRIKVEAPTSTGPEIFANFNVFSNGKTIFVTGDVVSAEVYSMMGRQVSKSTALSTGVQMNVPGPGMYIVKTTTSNGSAYNRKVVIH
jgi:hypothetical protein